MTASAPGQRAQNFSLFSGYGKNEMKPVRNARTSWTEISPPTLPPLAKRLKESSKFMSGGACLVQVLATEGQEVPARCRS